MKFGWLGRVGSELPRADPTYPGYNKADAVRSVRPKGKKCRLHMIIA
ncbi:MAG: hypothetical protein V3V48_08145 [Candidatus Aminicenantaceae bacterium]